MLTDGILEYKKLANSELSVVGIVNRNATEIQIPSIFDEMSVVKIEENAFADCVHLHDVWLGAIREVGACAFSGCINLQNVYHRMLYSKVDLGFQAFQGCINLQKVDINIRSIAEETFLNCVRLRTIQVSGCCLSVGPNAFCGCTKLEQVHFLASATALKIWPKSVSYIQIRKLQFDRNVEFVQDSKTPIPGTEYFPSDAKIYCSDDSNLTELCHFGREVIIEEFCDFF